MTASPTLQTLLDRLGIAENRIPASLADADRSPWYLWAMSALGACIAGAMMLWVSAPILGLLGLFGEPAGFGLGLTIFAGAIVLDRKLRHRAPLFFHTLALTLAFGGAMLCASSAAMLVSSLWAPAVILWLLTIGGAPGLRSPLLGFVGVLAAMGMTLAAMLTAGAPDLAFAAVAGVAVAIALTVMRFPPAGPLAMDLRPAAAALLAAPLPPLHLHDILSPTSLLGAAAYAIAALAVLWPGIGRRTWLISALPVAGISVLSPGAAASLLFLALAYGHGNRLLAALGVVGLVAAVGHLYYVLDMTLMVKAAILAACGLLTLTAWMASRTETRPAAEGLRPRRRAAAGIVAGLILIPAFIGWRVAINERILTDGREIHVALAPLDPRSLLQGDFMELRYDDRLLPPGRAVATLPRRGVLVVTVDDKTLVAQGVRLHEAGTALTPGEHLLAYRIRNGNLAVGADSFLFQEGTADAHDSATHGILRVAADGTALLTGLR